MIKKPAPRRWLPLRGCFPLVLLALGGLILPGCSFLRRLFGIKDAPAPEGSGGGDGESIFRIADLLEWIAWAFTLAGGACIAASILAAIFGFSLPFIKGSLGRIAFAGFAFIVAGQLLLWLGANLWWISLVVLVGALVVLVGLAWVNRRKAEPILGRDLDGDGIIGEPKETK